MPKMYSITEQVNAIDRSILILKGVDTEGETPQATLEDQLVRHVAELLILL